MPLINWPGTDTFTTVTVSGLYDNNTESPLFAASGDTAPTSGIQIGGTDGTNFFPFSVTSNGFLNVNATTTPPTDNTSTGAITTTQTVSVSTQGTSALMVQVEGAWTGTLDFESTLDGTTWEAFLIYPVLPDAAPSVSSTTVNGTWQAPVGGMRMFRVRGNTVATGTATIFLTAGQGQYSVVTVSPVAANNLAQVSQPTAANLQATVTQGTSPWVENLTQVAGVALSSTGVTAFGGTPTGTVPGVNSSIYAGTTGITATGSSLNVNVTNTVTVTGTVAVTQSTSPWVVAGNLTNNNAAPAANNVGVLSALANAASPAYTEGDQVLLSVDLTGRARVRGTAANNTAAPTTDLINVQSAVATATPQTYTQGNMALPTVSLGGALRVVPVDEANASSLNYYSVDDGNAFVANLVNATITPLVSIRSSSAAFLYLIRSLSTFTDGSQILFRLYKNPTLTGATFAATAPTGSHVNFDTAATVVTAGQVVWSGYSSSNMRAQDEQLYYLAAGTPGDVFTLAAEKFGSGTAKAAGSLQWSESAAAL